VDRFVEQAFQATAMLDIAPQQLHLQSHRRAGVADDGKIARPHIAQACGKSNCSLVAFHGHFDRPALIYVKEQRHDSVVGKIDVPDDIAWRV
jgi:hypothetical protein